MTEEGGNTVGTWCLLELEFQGKSSLLRHKAGRVMVTWMPPQSIRNIYGDLVPCASTVLWQECKKWPFPQGLDCETEDEPVC